MKSYITLNAVTGSRSGTTYCHAGNHVQLISDHGDVLIVQLLIPDLRKKGALKKKGDPFPVQISNLRELE